MLKLEDVVQIEEQVYRNLGMVLKETDHIQNSISRAYIRTFRNHHGKCFMGEFGKKELKEYKKGMVRNFECDFIIPCNDTEILSIKTLVGVMEKIKSLEGVLLRWV